MTRTLRRPAGLAFALVAALAGAASAQDSGYTPLFDGKTLSGWEFKPVRPGLKTNWEVKDGLLVGTGEASMIYSPRGDYTNFRFRAEIKINDKGNSGMYFRCPKPDGSFTGGYEAQINSTHTDPIRSGSIYTMVHVYKQLHKPDEFFTQEVEVVDRDYRGKVVTFITVFIDGEKIYELIDHDRTFKKGHFAFQQHDPGSVVQIRKIEVKELPPTKE